MLVRPYSPSDQARLVDLTIDTFGPFYEESFRPLVGDDIFTNQHGNWRDDYRRGVPELHDPTHHRYVAVAEEGGSLLGYVAWTVDPDRRHGEITHVAVAASHRRAGTGAVLCEHAFASMRGLGADVAVIGTGGDAFHAPARALYEALECTMLPTAVYYRRL